MAPMTAEELPKHPEYNHTIWDLKPTTKASLPVAAGRGGPLNIAYEIHGHGNIHLVVRFLQFYFFFPLSLFYSTLLHAPARPPSLPSPNIPPPLPKWHTLQRWICHPSKIPANRASPRQSRARGILE